MAVVFPTSESELRHIFREEEGHVADTPENRRLILEVANDMSARLSPDQYGNSWAARLLPGGQQVWVRIRADTINNGGINAKPRKFNPKTGLNRP
jgi:filamentous hemagglutinin